MTSKIHKQENSVPTNQGVAGATTGDYDTAGSPPVHVFNLTNSTVYVATDDGWPAPAVVERRDRREPGELARETAAALADVSEWTVTVDARRTPLAPRARPAGGGQP